MHNTGNKSIQLYVNDSEFKVFQKAVFNEINEYVTVYCTASKCFEDLIEECYDEEKWLDYFLIINEAPLLLEYISLIYITKEFE